MDFSLAMFREIPNTIYFHYKAGNINYIMTGFHIVTHTLALIGLYNWHKAKALTLFFAWQMTWLR
jgi:hypothetical protein